MNPTLGHETAANWWNIFFAWFKEHMKRTDIEEVSLHSLNVGMLPVYNLQGAMVAPAGTSFSALPRGVYVIGGRKVVR